MKKKAIIFDLDNTIYPVESIGEDLFKSLFQLITDVGEYEGDIQQIKKDIMRKPFQKVGADYSFSEHLLREGTSLLKNLSYNKKMSLLMGMKKRKKYLVKSIWLRPVFLSCSKVKLFSLEL